MLSTKEIENSVVWACVQEVSAPKPGNVNGFSDGHNMSIQNFIDSAHAIAPVLSRNEQTTGEMILNAVRATRTVVDCNTNLGIILLFVPLCKAIHSCQHFEQLPAALSRTLDALTLKDTELTYQAIQIAEPGGLGKSNEQDIHSTPTVALKQAMQLAQDYDSIAAQYTNNYHDIFEVGLSNLTLSINCGESVEWATAFAYLKLLSATPDSLICRKQGLACATTVMNRSKKIVEKVTINRNLSEFETDITLWDQELKQNAINPGTTADMAAASLLVYAFSQALS
jgi:triphosphoribosyl-dephospho-CoA synthase